MRLAHQAEKPADGRARNWGKSDHAGSASTTNSLSLSLANVTKRSLVSQCRQEVCYRT